MIEDIEKALKYNFKEKELLLRALIRKDNFHTAMGNKAVETFHSVEKMLEIGHQKAFETLGDSIIYVYLLECFIESPIVESKDMHEIKVQFGQNEALKAIAKHIDLQDFVYWSDNEEAREVWVGSDKVLADCFEALIGAVYLDGEMDSVKHVLDGLRFIDFIKSPVLFYT